MTFKLRRYDQFACCCRCGCQSTVCMLRPLCISPLYFSASTIFVPVDTIFVCLSSFNQRDSIPNHLYVHTPGWHHRQQQQQRRRWRRGREQRASHPIKYWSQLKFITNRRLFFTKIMFIILWFIDDMRSAHGLSVLCVCIMCLLIIGWLTGTDTLHNTALQCYRPQCSMLHMAPIFIPAYTLRLSNWQHRIVSEAPDTELLYYYFILYGGIQPISCVQPLYSVQLLDQSVCGWNECCSIYAHILCIEWINKKTLLYDWQLGIVPNFTSSSKSQLIHLVDDDQ